MAELQRRGLIESANRPVIGDYAEVLVARALSAEAPPGPDTGVDLITADGTTLQVKARRDPAGGQATHFDFSNLRERRFDSFVGVLFAEDFSVRGAWQMQWDVLNALARPNGRKHRVRIKDIERAAVSNEAIEAIEL